MNYCESMLDIFSIIKICVIIVFFIIIGKYSLFTLRALINCLDEHRLYCGTTNILRKIKQDNRSIDDISKELGILFNDSIIRYPNLLKSFKNLTSLLLKYLSTSNRYRVDDTKQKRKKIF